MNVVEKLVDHYAELWDRIMLPSILSTTLLAWGIVIHLVCDWPLQNNWMANNKSNPKHIAGYVHAGLHTLGLCLIFSWQVALCIGILHWLIDLRFPLAAWRKFYKQEIDDSRPVTLHAAIWNDQVVHIAIIAIAALLVGK